MNPIFVNKYLPFREQDTKNGVLLFFFALLPASALLPHGHLFSAFWALGLFAYGVWKRGGDLRADLLFSAFLALTLSGVVLANAWQASFLSFCLRLSFFLPSLLEDKKDETCRFISLLGGALGAMAALELLLGGGTAEYNDQSLFSALSRAELIKIMTLTISNMFLI